VGGAAGGGVSPSAVLGEFGVVEGGVGTVTGTDVAPLPSLMGGMVGAGMAGVVTAVPAGVIVAVGGAGGASGALREAGGAGGGLGASTSFVGSAAAIHSKRD